MEKYQAEILRIKELLSANREGLSITEITGMLTMNRNTVAKYMDILQIQGSVDGRRKGTSKVYFLSERLPVASLRKFCTRPFFVTNQDGKVTDHNHEFDTLVGMARDQLTGLSIENLPVRFLEATSPGAAIKAVLKGTEQRIRAQVRQGEKILPVTLLMIPGVFETGRPGISVIIEMDDPTTNSNRREAVSFDVTGLLDDGFEYVIRRTAEGITQYVNEPYCRAAGKSREELVGRPFKPLISPEDTDRIRTHIAGLNVQYPVGTIEYGVVMANGELHHLRWQDRAVFNSRGELDTINSFGIDITEQVLATRKLKNAQETLEDSIVHRTEELRGINRQLYQEIAQREQMEEQLLLAQFAMDRSTDMVFWITQNARIRYANDVAADALQYGKTELLDCTLGDIVPGYTITDWDQVWQKLKQGGQVSYETPLVKKDGTRFPAEIHLTYLEYRGKEFVYGSSRDLTERIRLDRALKEANKKINIYTSIARHDIQNKITILLAYLSRTKKSITDPRLLDYLNHQELAAKAIRTEINLTREFKDLGSHPPVWQNIPALVDGVVHRYEQAVRISTDLPDADIFADGQLALVFDRLIGRSQEHRADSPEIRISHHVKDNTLFIVIEDNGPGFSPEEKEQIFDVQNNGSGDHGLLIAREILSLTGIDLTENGIPGTGTRFEIRIPETYYRFTAMTP